MARRDANGRLTRPPRPTTPEADLTSAAGMVDQALFHTHEAANTAGFCMSDNLTNDGAVRDMHDIIGALGAAQAMLTLIRHRAVTRDEAIAAGASVCTATYLRHPNLPCSHNYDGDRRHSCRRLTHDGRHRCVCGDEWDAPTLPRGLCGNRGDHEPHQVTGSTVGPFWCTARQEDRLPYAAERHRAGPAPEARP